MKRAARWTLSRLAVISLIFCVPTAYFWSRSYSSGDVVNWYGPPKKFTFMSSGGEFLVGWFRFTYTTTSEKPGWHGTIWPVRESSTHYGVSMPDNTMLGFRLQRWKLNSNVTVGDGWFLMMPYWFAALSFVTIPIITMGIYLREWRYRHGLPTNHCPACGYDLRATPDRCPECGHISKSVPPQSQL